MTAPFSDLSVALTVPTVLTATLGAFVGHAISADPDPVVATVLLLVGLFDLLGATRYSVDRAEYHALQRKISVYEVARTHVGGAEHAKERNYDEKIEHLLIKKAEFSGAWMLLPHLIVTMFALAMAATAYA